MSASPFSFLRGSAIVMAADLGRLPATGLRVQLCGDAHLLNFGVFAAPDRSLIFDINDFDETLPGPWEWDVKRLATSLAVASREKGGQGREAALAATRSYREWMTRYAAMDNAKVWYARIAAEVALDAARSASAEKTARPATLLHNARMRDHLRAFAKLTTSVDGIPQFIEDPPVIMHLTRDEGAERRAFADYRRSLPDERRLFLERFRIVDLAFKLVGIGSVGTRTLVALLMGRDDGDPLILQLKEAKPSMLEAYASRSLYRNHGRRVVVGQRIMQAASDVLLGWIRGLGGDGRDYYVRQLHDMKGAIPIARVRPAGLGVYAELCGWTLARAHARSGDRMAIAAYLGRSDRFDQAVAGFAIAYADQTERDFEALKRAIERGRVAVERGV